MLSHDDNPGLFYFLVGIIVLVLTAVGLSIVVEKRVNFSSGMGQTRRDITAETAELAELKAQYDVRSVELKEQLAKANTQATEYQKFRAEMATSGPRKLELIARKEKLDKELPALDTAFSTCRSDYRSKMWRKAIGESYPRLAIRGGREYLNVTITKVTEVGLEIRHEHGIARIQAPDLDSGWQERFQWSDEERRARLIEEDQRLQGQPAVVPADPQVDDSVGNLLTSNPPKLTDANGAETEAHLNTLRTQVIGWRSKVNILTSERSTALSNASRGNQTSVPGSLETWSAKASRLGNELVHAQVEHAQAKARLAAVSPSDPLLRTTYDPDH